jgi:AmmeMemoRadiSam system protein B
MQKTKNRKPAVADVFYPGNPSVLHDTVSRFLKEAKSEPAAGTVRAIMVPHAGYVYSGLTAAHGFRRVAGHKPDRIILMGPSHHYPFPRASIATQETFETPLGTLPVDTDFTQVLIREWGNTCPESHEPEHCLEVELPFIQEVFGEVPIVPILFGSLPSAWHIEAGRQLAEHLGPNDLVVLSTDLSHYHPDEEARRLDAHSLECLLSKDCARYMREARSGMCAMCGATAVLVGMACALATGTRNWQVLDYTTSARAFGDRDRVVGYAAVSMETETSTDEQSTHPE